VTRRGGDKAARPGVQQRCDRARQGVVVWELELGSQPCDRRAAASVCTRPGPLGGGGMGGTGQSIPCRLKARALGRGLGVQACGCGVQRLLQAAKGTRMKPTEAVTATDHGCGRVKGQTSTVGRGCQCRRADRRVRRSEGMRGEEGREAESTHHLLRRYRRRLCLILPGPIWGMRQRHVDSESALE